MSIDPYTLVADRFEAEVAIGTSPFVITSTTVSVNLNADLLDGQHGAFYLDPANLSVVVPVTKGGTGLSALGTARQLLQINAGATAFEWASNIDIPGTLDVTGAVVFDSTLGVVGKLTTAASATGSAGLNLPHGTAPTSPVNGDIWTTTAGLLAYINGATVGPFSTGVDVTANYTWTGTHIFNTNPVTISTYLQGDADHLELRGDAAATAVWRFNDLGQMAIGTDLEVWEANWRAIEFGNGNIAANTVSGSIAIHNNSYRGATTENYKSTAAAAAMLISAGTFTFYVAASGTEDTAISWTTALTISNTGKVNFRASTTAAASLNIAEGAAPTTPVDGDLWYDNGDVYFRFGGQTYTFNKTIV